MIPDKFKGYLGEYGPVLFDIWCGEPVDWGYKLLAKVNSMIYAYDMSLPNIERNKRMVLLRFTDPKAYTVNKLATIEGITKQAVHRNLKRDWNTFLTKEQLKKQPQP
jgi:hypothetical protein